MIFFAAMVLLLTGFAFARWQCSYEVECMRSIANTCLKEANDLRDEIEELKGENLSLQAIIKRRF